MPHKNQFRPHCYKGRFYNQPDERNRSTVFPSLIMIFEWYWNTLRKGGVDTSSWYAPELPLCQSEELAITWIGHSTFLIQASGINILTDPLFGSLPFFQRQLKPGIELAQIPSIDFVLISHNHRDHMDEAALTFLKEHPRCTFLVPLGDGEWFRKRGFKQVREYTWWEQDRINALEITFLPAQHWSQRGLLDYNTSLWGSWMLKIGGNTIYFAGDTAYHLHFSAIAKEFPSITHAIMPIGPCEPRKWMHKTHMNAEESVQAFIDLQAHYFVPMHWGTFNFGTDQYQEPYERLLSAWNKEKFPFERLITLRVGQRTVQPSRPSSDLLIPTKEPQTPIQL
jgi:L-ascorbate metabolism protein UlaG (beta-lactamase superfamily)